MLSREAAGPFTALDVRRGLPWEVGVGIRVAGVGQLPALHEIEEGILGSRAVERRRLAFTLGRAAARDALRELGVVDAELGDLEDVAIGRGPAGEPLWPAGVVGAISHAGDVAVAIVGRARDYAGLGIDIEEVSRDLSPKVARLICRPAEIAWVDVDAGLERLIMLFSAKEAVFKALFPIERVWLGFGDAELTWVPERRLFEARIMKSAGVQYPAGVVLEVPCTVARGMVLSVTWAEP